MSPEEKARKKLEAQVYWDVVSRRPDSLPEFVLKLLSEPAYARSVIRKHMHFGKAPALPILTTDRLIMEQQIFGYYQSRPEIHDILFVGCDADTSGYHQRYFKNARFVTIEPNPENRAYGATEHIIGVMEDLHQHYAPESFDLVLCNGVFGWGLDDFNNCEAAFEQTHRALRPGGSLMLGWNDVPRRAPFPLETIKSLAKFHKDEFPPFKTWRYLTDTVYRHTYDFYRK